MAKLSSQPLKPNPFITRRDPKTGMWLVIEPESTEKLPENDKNHSKDLINDQPQALHSTA
jgi:hypothetical protein